MKEKATRKSYILDEPTLLGKPTKKMKTLHGSESCAQPKKAESGPRTNHQSKIDPLENEQLDVDVEKFKTHSASGDDICERDDSSENTTVRTKKLSDISDSASKLDTFMTEQDLLFLSVDYERDMEIKKGKKVTLNPGVASAVKLESSVRPFSNETTSKQANSCLRPVRKKKPAYNSGAKKEKAKKEKVLKKDLDAAFILVGIRDLVPPKSTDKSHPDADKDGVPQKADEEDDDDDKTETMDGEHAQAGEHEFEDESSKVVMETYVERKNEGHQRVKPRDDEKMESERKMKECAMVIYGNLKTGDVPKSEVEKLKDKIKSKESANATIKTVKKLAACSERVKRDTPVGSERLGANSAIERSVFDLINETAEEKEYFAFNVSSPLIMSPSLDSQKNQLEACQSLNRMEGDPTTKRKDVVVDKRMSDLTTSIGKSKMKTKFTEGSTPAKKSSLVNQPKQLTPGKWSVVSKWDADLPIKPLNAGKAPHAVPATAAAAASAAATVPFSKPALSSTAPNPVRLSMSSPFSPNSHSPLQITGVSSMSSSSSMSPSSFSQTSPSISLILSKIVSNSTKNSPPPVHYESSNPVKNNSKILGSVQGLKLHSVTVSSTPALSISSTPIPSSTVPSSSSEERTKIGMIQTKKSIIQTPNTKQTLFEPQILIKSPVKDGNESLELLNKSEKRSANLKHSTTTTVPSQITVGANPRSSSRISAPFTSSISTPVIPMSSTLNDNQINLKGKGAREKGARKDDGQKDDLRKAVIKGDVGQLSEVEEKESTISKNSVEQDAANQKANDDQKEKCEDLKLPTPAQTSAIISSPLCQASSLPFSPSFPFPFPSVSPHYPPYPLPQIPPFSSNPFRAPLPPYPPIPYTHPYSLHPFYNIPSAIPYSPSLLAPPLHTSQTTSETPPTKEQAYLPKVSTAMTLPVGGKRREKRMIAKTFYTLGEEINNDSSSESACGSKETTVDKDMNDVKYPSTKGDKKVLKNLGEETNQCNTNEDGFNEKSKDGKTKQSKDEEKECEVKVEILNCTEEMKNDARKGKGRGKVKGKKDSLDRNVQGMVLDDKRKMNTMTEYGEEKNIDKLTDNEQKEQMPQEEKNGKSTVKKAKETANENEIRMEFKNDKEKEMEKMNKAKVEMLQTMLIDDVYEDDKGPRDEGEDEDCGSNIQVKQINGKSILIDEENNIQISANLNLSASYIGKKKEDRILKASDPELSDSQGFALGLNNDPDIFNPRIREILSFTEIERRRIKRLESNRLSASFKSKKKEALCELLLDQVSSYRKENLRLQQEIERFREVNRSLLKEQENLMTELNKYRSKHPNSKLPKLLLKPADSFKFPESSNFLMKKYNHTHVPQLNTLSNPNSNSGAGDEHIHATASPSSYPSSSPLIPLSKSLAPDSNTVSPSKASQAVHCTYESGSLATAVAAMGMQAFIGTRRLSADTVLGGYGAYGDPPSLNESLPNPSYSGNMISEFEFPYPTKPRSTDTASDLTPENTKCADVPKPNSAPGSTQQVQHSVTALSTQVKKRGSELNEKKKNVDNAENEGKEYEKHEKKEKRDGGDRKTENGDKKSTVSDTKKAKERTEKLKNIEKESKKMDANANPPTPLLSFPYSVPPFSYAYYPPWMPYPHGMMPPFPSMVYHDNAWQAPPVPGNDQSIQSQSSDQSSAKEQSQGRKGGERDAKEGKENKTDARKDKVIQNRPKEGNVSSLENVNNGISAQAGEKSIAAKVETPPKPSESLPNDYAEKSNKEDKANIDAKPPDATNDPKLTSTLLSSIEKSLPTTATATSNNSIPPHLSSKKMEAIDSVSTQITPGTPNGGSKLSLKESSLSVLSKEKPDVKHISAASGNPTSSSTLTIVNTSDDRSKTHNLILEKQSSNETLMNEKDKSMKSHPGSTIDKESLKYFPFTSLPNPSRPVYSPFSAPLDSMGMYPIYDPSMDFGFHYKPPFGSTAAFPVNQPVPFDPYYHHASVAYNLASQMFPWDSSTPSAIKSNPRDYDNYNQVNALFPMRLDHQEGASVPNTHSPFSDDPKSKVDSKTGNDLLPALVSSLGNGSNSKNSHPENPLQELSHIRERDVIKNDKTNVDEFKVAIGSLEEKDERHQIGLFQALASVSKSQHQSAAAEARKKRMMVYKNKSFRNQDGSKSR